MIAVLLSLAGGLLLWTPLLCLQPPSALAVAQNSTWPPMRLSQSPSVKEPPFISGGLQFRWDYSDLVCTGVAAEPKRTGIVEDLGGTDRDQLSARVELQTCFKGVRPAGVVTVLGDSVVASKDAQGGFVYAGPPTGFGAPGRNLLFLRASKTPHVWRVTVPVYAMCLELADVPPDYTLDGSEDSIRRALAAEIEAVIPQGHLREKPYGFLTLDHPEFVAAIYEPYILEIFGKPGALNELSRIMASLPDASRRVIAMELLRNGNQRSLPDTLAFMQDESVVAWQRANAARALEYAPSPRAQLARSRLRIRHRTMNCMRRAKCSRRCRKTRSESLRYCRYSSASLATGMGAGMVCSASITASANSVVPAFPPTSRVTCCFSV
jgi:hypothetical protein